MKASVGFALVFTLAAGGCRATATVSSKPPGLRGPSLDGLVELAADYRAIVAKSQLTPGLHRFETRRFRGSISGAFMDWAGHPLLTEWVEGRVVLRAVDDTGVQAPVAFVDQSIAGLQTSIVEVHDAAPWIQYWTTSGPARVGINRIDGNESRELLSLPWSEGMIEAVALSGAHQGIAQVTPVEWEDYRWTPIGPPRLHLLGNAAGVVVDVPHRPGLEHRYDELLLSESHAVAIYEFRNANAELVETVLVFIDLATGDAREQAIADPRIEDWHYLEGGELVRTCQKFCG